MTAPSARWPRLQRFTDRYPWLGPLVFVASALYFLAQLVVAAAWHPPYSISANTISDLGDTTCGRYGAAYVCSPRHALMNAAFIFLGVVMAVGSMLIHQEFVMRPRSERLASFAGFSLLAVAGAGTVLVGVFPENSIHLLHIVGAGLAIGVGNVGIVILGLRLRLPELLRRCMLGAGAVSLVALVLFAARRDLGLGAGGMERVAAYPETIWLIAFGLYMFEPTGWRAARAEPSATSRPP